MSDVIKSLRQKHNSAFTDKIDFQLEGKSINMIGDLNLEEKLRLDNLKNITINKFKEADIITEKEYPILGGTPSCYSYTGIKEQGDTTIVLTILDGCPQNQDRAKVSIIKKSGITEYYIDSDAALTILNSWERGIL